MTDTTVLDMLSDGANAELRSLEEAMRAKLDAGLDFEAEVCENLEDWLPRTAARYPLRDSPRFIVRPEDEKQGSLFGSWAVPAWLRIRVLGPREGKSACVVIAHHRGWFSKGGGARAADILERVAGTVCGESMTVVRIALDEDPETAYGAKGATPPFAALLRYDSAGEASRAAEFWRADAGAGFLWYPSAGHDTRPLAWFLPRLDEPPRAKVDYFVLSTLGEPTFERLVRSARRDGAAGKILFSDRVSRLSVVEAIPFFFDEERVLWYVGRAYAFREGNERPSIRGVNGLLVRTRFESSRLGTFEQKLVLVEMENSAFEHEVVREGLLNPSVYCAVRDGCGFGGNMRCENSLDHVDDLFSTRTFSPSWWVTDHIAYRGDDGVHRKHWFERDGNLPSDTLYADLTPRLWARKCERSFGVSFIELGTRLAGQEEGSDQ